MLAEHMGTATEQAIAILGAQPAFRADSEVMDAALGLLDTLESSRSVHVYALDMASFAHFAASRKRALRGADRSFMQSYLAHLRDRKLAPATRRRMVSVIRSMFREMIERRLLPGPNPAERIGRIDGEPEIAEPALSLAEVRALFAAVEAEMADAAKPGAALRARRDRLILSLFIWLALRCAELSGLRRSDYKVRNGFTVLQITGKGDKPAAVKINAQISEEIEAWEAALSAAGVERTENDPLFIPLGRGWPPPAWDGRERPPSLSARTIGAMVHRRLVDIARDGHRASPHLLRRTSITLVWQATGDLVLAQRHARHKLSSTTERHYIKPLDEMANAGIDHIRLPGVALPQETRVPATSARHEQTDQRVGDAGAGPQARRLAKRRSKARRAD
jgi:integrase